MQLRYGTPEEAGMRSEAVGNIRWRAQQWVSKGGTPAVELLAARRGVIFLHEAYGRLAPIEDSPILSKDALFPLASLTKPVTATALMILIEDGLVGLNRPVQEYIQEFRGEGKEAVMLHHLLTHTSGIRDEDWEKEIEAGARPSEIPALDKTMHSKVNELLFLLYRTPLGYSPGKEMYYAGANYYLLGEIIRRVSEKSLEQYAREMIFDPLGMDDSYFVVPGDAQLRVVRRPEDALGYIYEDPEFMERPSPSGGAYSTAFDMAKFGQMFLNRGNYGSARVLSPAAAAAMTRNQIPGISADFLDQHFPEAGWGFGWSIGYPYKGRVYGELLPSPGFFNHGGSGGVEMWLDPRNEIVGVYFSVALERDQRDFTIQDADLFMNMVTAGISAGDFGDASAKSSRQIAQSPVEPESRSGTAAGAAIRPAAPSRALDLHAGTPEEAGADPERVDKIRDLASGWVESGMHPALHMIAARHGVIFLDETLGRMGPEENATPLMPDALFPLASISKPITAAAAMILVEEGLLALNRPVNEYIPEFQGDGKEQITIRHLLTHTSGLMGEDLFESAVGQGIVSGSVPTDENWAVLRDRPFSEYLDLIYALPPSDTPDKKMVYASLNYDIVGEIVARVSGTSLSEFVTKRIFEPLGMSNTFIPLPRNLSNRVVRRPESAPYQPILAAILERSLQSGSSGFWAAAKDLAVFGQMFLNGGTYGSARILSPATTAAMTRDQIPGIEATFEGQSFGSAEWGLGWSIHNTKKSWAYDEPLLSSGSFCHSGTGGVFVWIDPPQEMVAVFFSVYLEDTKIGQPVAATDLFINSVLASLVETKWQMKGSN